MADNNRLEFDIVSVDQTDAGNKKAIAGLRSVEQEAARSAAGMSKGFDAQGIELARSIDKATASAVRSLDALERRAALAGKTGIEKLAAQRDASIRGLGADEAAIKRVSDAYGRLIAAQEKSAAAASKRKVFGTLSGLEEEASGAGLSAVQSLLKRRTDTLAKLAALGAGEAETQQAQALFKKLIDAEGGGGTNWHYALRRGGLAVKDALEGRTQGTVIELTDVLTGTSGGGGLLGGGALKRAVGGIAEIAGVSSGAVIGVSALAAGFLALDAAGIVAMHSLAKTGEEIRNISLRTGLAGDQVQGVQFAAKASGVNPDIVDRLARGLAQLADDNSSAGKKGRDELTRLGVSLTDQYGALKPTETLLLQLSDAINKLPPGLQETAASMEILKRAGVDAVPFLKDFRQNIDISDQIGHTFTDEQLSRMEEWRKKIVTMSEVYGRLKFSIEGVLATVANVPLQNIEKFLGLVTGAYEKIHNIVATPEAPARPSVNKETGVDFNPPTGAQGQALRDQTEGELRISRFQASQGFDGQIEAARKKLQADGELTISNSAQYIEDYNAVKALEAAQKSADTNARDLVDAAKQRQELLSQAAQIRESTQLKEVSGESKKELISPEDAGQLLDLAKQRALAEQQRFIEAHRTVDEKTGRIIEPGPQFLNAANANLPQLVENEQAKVQAEIDTHNAAYAQKQQDDIFKPWAEARKRKEESVKQFQEFQDREQEQAAQHYFSEQQTEASRERDLALQNVGLIDAQTLQQKQALEAQKLSIEQEYVRRSLAIQLQKIDSERIYAENELLKKNGGNAEDPDYLAAKELIDNRYSSEAEAARQAASDKLLTETQQTANDQAKLLIESNRSIFDSLKHDAEGFWDALFSKNPGAALKNFFKDLFLKPLKDILSSQTAGLLTEALTGSKVSFSEIGSGQGPAGKVGGILGRLGLGKPTFGTPQHELSKLNQPNHLGDVLLVSSTDGSGVSNAVPVAITNYAQLAQSHVETAKLAKQTLGSSSPSGNAPISQDYSVTSTINYAAPEESKGSAWTPLLAGIGTLAAAGTAAASTTASASSGLRDAVTSTIKYATGGSESFGYGPPVASGISDIFGSLPGAGAYFPTAASSSGGAGIFSSLGGILGGPGGTSGFAGPVTGSQSSGGGILGGLFNGLLGGGSSSGGGGGIFGSLFGGGGSSSGSGGGLLGNLLGGGGGTGGGFLSGLKGLLGQNVSGVDLGNGVGIANTTALGHLAAFGQSGLAGTFGLGLALDGIKRGGLGGTLEAAGGGALAGFKFGGPIGAVIGAAVGAGAALIRTFIGDDRSHTKDLVKQIYGISINNATADQIIQIAKQSYGGQISVAVRSPQVRELLRLYAQTLGTPKQQAQFVADKPHSLDLVESGGKLYQQAVYDNGQAYSYNSPLSVYGGTQTTPLPTFGPNSGGLNVGSLSLQLNGQAASDLLAGQVADVATPGFVQSQALAGSAASIGRTSQTAMTLAPSAINR